MIRLLIIFSWTTISLSQRIDSSLDRSLYSVQVLSGKANDGSGIYKHICTAAVLDKETELVILPAHCLDHRSKLFNIHVEMLL